MHKRTTLLAIAALLPGLGWGLDGGNARYEEFVGFVIGCREAKAEACHEIGHIFQRKKLADDYGVEPNLDIALDYFDYACQLGHKNSCEDRIKIRALDKRLADYSLAYARVFMDAQCRVKVAEAEACKNFEKLTDSPDE